MKLWCKILGHSWEDMAQNGFGFIIEQKCSRCGTWRQEEMCPFLINGHYNFTWLPGKYDKARVKRLSKLSYEEQLKEHNRNLTDRGDLSEKR